MARTEDAVRNAFIKAFTGAGKTNEAKPTKSYMAIALSIPMVGAHYMCQRLERDAHNQLHFIKTETTTVQRVGNLAGNVFIVETRNSYYITRVLQMPVENVHFAVVTKEPKIGEILKCNKIEFCGVEKCRFTPWKTTTVQEAYFIKGLYKVKTNNSTYVCFPMM